jgi:hypothetical protein
VVAVEAGHTTPTADPIDRIKCQNRLLSDMHYGDLLSVDAERIVISVYSENFQEEKSLAQSKPYLRLVDGDEAFLVYAVDQAKEKGLPKQAPYGPCLQYQAIERR